MKFIDEIIIGNFKIIKSAKLEKLSSLNIFVGPNNSGKSSLIEAIKKFTQLQYGGPYKCQTCEKFRSGDAKFREMNSQPFSGSIGSDELYFHSINEIMKMEIKFNKDWVSEVNPQLDQAIGTLNGMGCNQASAKVCSIELVGNGGGLNSMHISSVSLDTISRLGQNLIEVNSNRIEKYKNSSLQDYAKSLEMTHTRIGEFVKYLKELVDPFIEDLRDFNLIRDDKNYSNEAFPVGTQGSGTKALYGLVLDIITQKDAGLVLIDEPELGLNQTVKMNLLRKLLELSGKKQVFIATQDSTFINPLLFKDNKDVSVYVYSPASGGGFVKANIETPLEYASSFAGFLPHTTSTKEYHIYVEGPSDVFIFSIFLERYLKAVSPNDWFLKANSVGVFSFGGNNWVHILYTVPKRPYKCLVVLDGDKRGSAKGVIDGYKTVKTDRAEMMYCESLDKITEALRKEEHPVYVLSKGCIEEYFGLDCKNLPADYKKIVDSPKSAEEMETIPDEINEIFDRFFGWGKKHYASITEHL